MISTPYSFPTAPPRVETLTDMTTVHSYLHSLFLNHPHPTPSESRVFRDIIDISYSLFLPYLSPPSGELSVFTAIKNFVEGV